MSINNIQGFVFENYYKGIGFSKENSYYSKKHMRKKDLLQLANKYIEKIPDPRNAKEQYQSSIRKKKRNVHLSNLWGSKHFWYKVHCFK